MYIENTRTYYTADGSQRTGRGRFLILVEPDIESGKYPLHGNEIRALVRTVALRQCGAWMVGTARAFGHSIHISGSYGADGLTRMVPDEVYERATPVPLHLIEEWNKGGGWNGAGSEAGAMREWGQSIDQGGV